MMRKRRFSQHHAHRIAASLLFLFCWFWAHAQEKPSKIVAIGNLHGEYETLVSLLKANQLVGDDLHWTGSDAILIQTGDFLDRGAGVRDIMDLLQALERQAEETGGRVITLMGDHEAMNILGTMREINPEIFEDFVDSSSKSRSHDAFDQYLETYKETHDRIIKPHEIKALRRQWNNRYPLGYLEYLQAMGPTGAYGKWLRSLPAAVVVDGILFVHAGLDADSQFTDIQAIQSELATDIETADKLHGDLLAAGLADEFNTWMECYQAASRAVGDQASGLADHLSPQSRQRVEVARAFLNFAGGILLDPDGPFLFRGYETWKEFEGKRHLEPLLADWGVTHVVCGHTPQPGGTQCRFEGRAILLNSGIIRGPEGDLEPSALEIKGDSFTAVTRDSRRPINPSAHPKQVTERPVEPGRDAQGPGPVSPGKTESR